MQTIINLDWAVADAVTTIIQQQTGIKLHIHHITGINPYITGINPQRYVFNYPEYGFRHTPSMVQLYTPFMVQLSIGDGEIILWYYIGEQPQYGYEMHAYHTQTQLDYLCERIQSITDWWTKFLQHKSVEFPGGKQNT